MSSKREKKNSSKRDSESEEDELNDVVQKTSRSKVKKVDKKSKKRADDKSTLNDETVNQDVVEDSPDENKVDNIPAEKKKIRELIDPSIPIKNLSTLQILNYLIQVGEDTSNPTLRFGSINLLNELRGRPRRFNNHNKSYFPPRGSKTYYGSKSRRYDDNIRDNRPSLYKD